MLQKPFTYSICIRNMTLILAFTYKYRVNRITDITEQEDVSLYISLNF